MLRITSGDPSLALPTDILTQPLTFTDKYDHVADNELLSLFRINKIMQNFKNLAEGVMDVLHYEILLIRIISGWIPMANREAAFAIH